MDDSNLTRRAIEEIVHETGARKGPDQFHEKRKVNCLGKTNKRFLDRTLSSILTYNRREDDRTRRSCDKKLRHLEYVQWRRLERRKRQRSPYNEEISLSCSSDNTTSDSAAKNITHNNLSKKTKDKIRASNDRNSVRWEDQYYGTKRERCDADEEHDPNIVIATADNHLNHFMQCRMIYGTGSQATVVSSTHTPANKLDIDIEEFEKDELTNLDELPISIRNTSSFSVDSSNSSASSSPKPLKTQYKRIKWQAKQPIVIDVVSSDTEEEGTTEIIGNQVGLLMRRSQNPLVEDEVKDEHNRKQLEFVCISSESEDEPELNKRNYKFSYVSLSSSSSV